VGTKTGHALKHAMPASQEASAKQFACREFKHETMIARVGYEHPPGVFAHQS